MDEESFFLPEGDRVRINEYEYSILEDLAISLRDHVQYISWEIFQHVVEADRSDCAVVTSKYDYNGSHQYLLRDEKSGEWYKTAVVDDYSIIFYKPSVLFHAPSKSDILAFSDNQCDFAQVLAYTGSFGETIEDCIERGLRLLYRTASYIFNIRSNT